MRTERSADEHRTSGSSPATADEMIVIATARLLATARTAFVGIGLPSAAGILAQHLHNPELFIVYESGVLGARPDRLPLSVADPVLATTALTAVPVAEMFNYWLQPGRFDIGVLGAGQVDRFGNINSTVVGPYDLPRVRLPGAGGAPEIASSCRETIILIRQSPRSLVEHVDFVTTVGYPAPPRSRQQLGFLGSGPTAIVTDLAIYAPSGRGDLTLTALQRGATVQAARESSAWAFAVADRVLRLAVPTREELATLRELDAADAR